VSQTFGDRRQPLPALTLVQAGMLPLGGAQVVLEAETAARKDMNPHGLAWISGRVATSEDPLGPVAPLTARSLAALRQSVEAAGAEPRDALRVTCFFSSLDNLAASRALVEAEYPKAALDYIQTRRAPATALAACEAVVRLTRDPGSRLRPELRWATWFARATIPLRRASPGRCAKSEENSSTRRMGPPEPCWFSKACRRWTRALAWMQWRPRTEGSPASHNSAGEEGGGSGECGRN
jgi:enamine deaminase RidA (YjgF/YER057c/UK114 family)